MSAIKYLLLFFFLITSYSTKNCAGNQLKKHTCSRATSSAGPGQVVGKTKVPLSHAETTTKSIAITEEIALKTWAESEYCQQLMQK